VLARVARDSLARNSILIMASTVGTSALGYLYWMVAARSLPQSRIGTATALISAATVVSMVSNLGIGHMFIQRLPGSAAAAWSRTVGSGLLLGCASTAVAALVAAGALPRGFVTGPAGAAGLVATAVALTASTLLDYVFVAHRASHGMLWRNLALAVGKLLTLLALTAAGVNTAGAVLLAWTAPSLLVTAYTLRAALPRLRPLPPAGPPLSPGSESSAAATRPMEPAVRSSPVGAAYPPGGFAGELRHVRRSLTGHHLVNLAQAGPSALLPVLVTARLGAGENAHFYVAWMTASVLFMVSPAVASAFYAERSNDARASLPRAALVVLVVIGGPAAGLFVWGGWILGLFSAGYAAGGTLLKILVLAAVPDAVTNLAVAHWRSHGRLRRCLRLNLLMATTCLALTWLWLPVAGIAAAGLAWLAGQSAGALVVAALAVHARCAPGVPGRQNTARVSAMPRRPFTARPARPRRPFTARPARPRRPFTTRLSAMARRSFAGWRHGLRLLGLRCGLRFFRLRPGLRFFESRRGPRGERRGLSRARAPLGARPLARGGRGRPPASRLGRPARPAFRSRPRSRTWRVP
jgi:O-antigen/teichoic acid export membrane protein